MKTKKIINESVFYCSVLLILIAANPRLVRATVVAKYLFDEGDGNIAFDSSGNGNHGTITGATYLGTTSDTVFNDGALEFINPPFFTYEATDYVTIPDSPGFRPTDSLTIEVWVKPYPYGNTQGRMIIAKRLIDDVLRNCSYVLWYENAGGLSGNIAVGINFDGILSYLYAPFPSPGEWYHIKGEWDGFVMSLYVNDNLEDTLEHSGSIVYDGSPVMIGALDDEQGDGIPRSGWYGLMDQIIIHSRSIREVTIDIKPGSYPNSINLGSNGVVPVAILSSAEFDATTVNPETVIIAGAGVAIRGKGDKYLTSVEDVNGDGLLDLSMKVETENLDAGQLQGGMAILIGETYNGMEIEGGDEIIIVPPE